MREAAAIELETREQAVHELTLTALAAACSDAGIRVGLAAGRQLSGEAAISLALALDEAFRPRPTPASSQYP